MQAGRGYTRDPASSHGAAVVALHPEASAVADDRPCWMLTAGELDQRVYDAAARAYADYRAGEQQQDLVGPAEMARRLDISRTSLHRLRLEGCPALKLGDCFKFEPAAVLAWLRARS